MSAFERVLVWGGIPAPNKHLADDRYCFSNGGPKHTCVQWHIAPTQQSLAFGFDVGFQQGLAGPAYIGVLGQEDNANPIVPERWQFEANFRTFGSEEIVGNLQQDPGTVSHVRISADCPPVGEVN